MGKIVSGGTKTTDLEVGFRPGVAVNVSERVSLIGKFGFLGYQYGKTGSGNTAAKTNSFGFYFDLNNIQLGMNLKF